MRKKRILMLMAMIFALSMGASAQGWLGKLKDKAVDAAKRTVERKVEQKAEGAVDGTMDYDASKKSRKSKRSGNGENNDGVEQEDAVVSQNQKSDFKRGSVIIFEDDFANEQMGEFPSKWDISDGSLEVASVNGKKYAHSNASGGSVFSPLMENMKSYLPDVFTLEWEEDRKSVV